MTDLAVTLPTKTMAGEAALGMVQEHRILLQTVRQFHGYGVQIHPTGLLKVCELRNLKAIQKYLPTYSPRP